MLRRLFTWLFPALAFWPSLSLFVKAPKGLTALRQGHRPQRLTLQVNDAQAAGPIRVQMNCQVNNAKIRTEIHNEREHIVVPSYTLPDGVVMNRGLYPAEEIEKAYAGLEGTLAPAGHPVVNGQYVAAGTIEAINGFHIGAWNRNVKREGHRVSVEKWIDVETAKQSEKGRAVLEAINKGEPIHTSTGIFLEREMTPNAKGYEWIARNMQMDHDAILIGEIGAATPAEGVGMMVNVADAKPVLGEGSYGDRQSKLSQAAREKWTDAWVADFDDTTAVVMLRDGQNLAVTYEIRGDDVIWKDAGQLVKTKTEWIANKFAKWFGLDLNSGASSTQQPSSQDADMTLEELKAALAESQAATVNAVQETIGKPLGDRLTALENNHKSLADSLTANERAKETEKRAAVTAKFGEVVANSVSGEALDALFAQTQGTAPALPGMHKNSVDQTKYDIPE